jgi:hypothetical protein
MSRRVGCFLAMGMIWGVPYLLIKVAVKVFTPASLVFLRTGMAAVHAGNCVHAVQTMSGHSCIMPSGCR